MYISIADLTTDADTESAHAAMRAKPGFRWAMLLRSLDAPEQLAAVSMWLAPEQAAAGIEGALGARGYDVTTARGSMTPASHLAIVDWRIEDATVAPFTARWNSDYHHIEDRISSRLLKDLDSPGCYAGLHAVTTEANLDPALLAATLTDAGGLTATPSAVKRYEVIRLTEA